MSKRKKYDYKIVQESTSCWSASIIRHVSSNKSNVSKTQSDFATEAEAIKWAETELETFLQAQAQRNSRKNEQRKKNEAQREERSNRRAAKTAAAKTENSDDTNTSTSEVWGKNPSSPEKVEADAVPSNPESPTES